MANSWVIHLHQGLLWQSADEVLLSGQKDIDDFFEMEKNYLVEYHAHIREATLKSDRMTKYHKARGFPFVSNYPSHDAALSFFCS